VGCWRPADLKAAESVNGRTSSVNSRASSVAQWLTAPDGPHCRCGGESTKSTHLGRKPALRRPAQSKNRVGGGFAEPRIVA